MLQCQWCRGGLASYVKEKEASSGVAGSGVVKLVAALLVFR